MQELELKDLDLNLLVIFLQLFRDRRVTTAAEALDLSQPGVSSASTAYVDFWVTNCSTAREGGCNQRLMQKS